MSHNITVESGTSVRLPTAGKYCDRDIVITAQGGAEDLNDVLTEQEALIAELQDTLKGKAAGGGGGGASVRKKDVNFYDYDGTLLHSYTVEEAQALNELPALPEQSGLICQGWNWSLKNIKAHNRAVDVGAIYTTDDGTTRIYITLQEGRTSPVLGVCPKGTVTVDWGDGTEPDVLTGTSVSTVKYTPNHEYAEPGDYVIRLAVDGEMGFYGSSSLFSCILRNASSSSVDNRDYAYRNAVQKIHIGDSVTSIGAYAFHYCYSLEYITIPNSVTSIGTYAFHYCYSLEYITIPNSVTSIGTYAFYYCCSLEYITIPNSVTSIGNHMFYGCYALYPITIPNSVTSIGNYTFYNCSSLATIVIPNSVTSIGIYAFAHCRSLASIAVPNSVMSVGASAFANCYSARFYDFSSHTAIPTLANPNAFSNLPADCEIRVPAALYDEWGAETNWSSLASNIVAA